MNARPLQRVAAVQAIEGARYSLVHWRVRGDSIQRGVEQTDGYIRWTTIPFLSTFLIAEKRERAEFDADGIPF